MAAPPARRSGGGEKRLDTSRVSGKEIYICVLVTEFFGLSGWA